jgi:hypothetical protein
MRHFTTIVVAIAVGTVAFERSAAGQPHHVHTIEILVMNEAEVPRELLQRAQDQAARIFQPTEVRLTWSDPTIAISTSHDAALRLTLKIISKPKLDGVTESMGLAIKGGTLAYVFYDRVTEFARQRRCESTQVLGHVLAHELGHLLLQRRPHSVNGVMRGSWDRAHDVPILCSSHGLPFTTEEANLIRRRLMLEPR